jgi:hypothetical protein
MGAQLAGAMFLIVLTVVSVAVSVNILLRGKIWRSLKPGSRPRRWVIVLLLVSLVTTFVWLPTLCSASEQPSNPCFDSALVQRFRGVLLGDQVAKWSCRSNL